MKQQEILQLHNAMWPGIVGKGEGADEPDISLAQMLDLTAQTRVNGHGFDGIDLNLMEPHMDGCMFPNEVLESRKPGSRCWP